MDNKMDEKAFQEIVFPHMPDPDSYTVEEALEMVLKMSEKSMASIGPVFCGTMSGIYLGYLLCKKEINLQSSLATLVIEELFTNIHTQLVNIINNEFQTRHEGEIGLYSYNYSDEDANLLHQLTVDLDETSDEKKYDLI